MAIRVFKVGKDGTYDEIEATREALQKEHGLPVGGLRARPGLLQSPGAPPGAAHAAGPGGGVRGLRPRSDGYMPCRTAPVQDQVGGRGATLPLLLPA